MAQEDVKIRDDYQKLMSRCLKEAEIVFPLLFNNDDLFGFVKSASKNDIMGTNVLSDRMNRFLDVLNKSVVCAHIYTEDMNCGRDSHYEYFKKRCIHCGKILEEWSV